MDRARLFTDILSFGGLEIFRAANDKAIIASRGLKVIKETVAPQTSYQDIYKVTELYGYAPDKVYNLYSSQIISAYGTSDPAGALTVSSRCGTFDYVDATDYSAHKVNAFFGSYDALKGVYVLPFATAAEIADFGVGDSVVLNMPYHQYSGWTALEVETAYTPIVEKGSTSYGSGYIKIAAIDAALKTTGDAVSMFEMGRFLTGYPSLNNTDIAVLTKNQYFRRPFKLSRYKKITKPSSRKVSIHQQISYLESAPAALEQKFQPKAADASDTDTIDEYSTPNITLWKKIKSGTATASELSGVSGVFVDGTFLAEDAEVQNIHTLYKKILKRAKCI